MPATEAMPGSPLKTTSALIQDAGMQMCLAYFWGIEPRKVALAKQMNVHGEFSPDTMWNYLEYFLRAVVPEAEQHGIKLALHPDDPPIDTIRGIPRIMTSVDAFKRLIEMVPSDSNGLTFCQGSFASMGDEHEGVDIPAAIEYFGKRGKIHFVHFRDVRGNKNNFEETAVR